MMNNEISTIYKQNLINDEPIEIVEGFKIYPVKMRDYIMYATCSRILQIDKNSINDPAIISMSYLDFLIHLIEQDNKSGVIGTVFMFQSLFSMVTNDNNCDIRYYKDEKGKTVLSINGTEFRKKEFDKLRNYILCQNSPDYKDEYINPDLKADIDKANELRNRGIKPKDIEYLIMSVVLGTGMSYEQVLDMTIRRFHIASGLIEDKLTWQMATQAKLNGFVEIKQPIPHYLSESNNGIENSVVDYAQFKDKIANA